MKHTILITAYAVNPYKGSEDGIGWNIIRGLAAKNDLIAITRENNAPPIERYLAEHPLPAGQRLRFEHFDLPYWMRFWKKGGRGSSLYHIMWHFGVVFFIWKKRFRFDVAHHLNFNADWSPSFLYLLGKPFVWGPVGHHHKIPRNYILPHGKMAWLKDRLMWAVKSYFWKIDPFLWLTRRTARKVIGLNSSVFEVMRVAPEKQVIIPAAANELPVSGRVSDRVRFKPHPVGNGGNFNILSIGRFVPLKGFDITLRAFAKCFHAQKKESQKGLKLTLIGKGPMKAGLKKMAADLGLPTHAIHFVDWVERRELDAHFAFAKLFVFPSHEGAGMVVPEALSFGLPVVVFDNYGPGEFVDESCAIKVQYTDYEQSVAEFAAAISSLFHDEGRRMEMAENARQHFAEHFTWEGKAERIQAVYEEVFGEMELTENRLADGLKLSEN